MSFFEYLQNLRMVSAKFRIGGQLLFIAIFWVHMLTFTGLIYFLGGFKVFLNKAYQFFSIAGFGNKIFDDEKMQTLLILKSHILPYFAFYVVSYVFPIFIFGLISYLLLNKSNDSGNLRNVIRGVDMQNFNMLLPLITTRKKELILERNLYKKDQSKIESFLPGVVFAIDKNMKFCLSQKLSVFVMFCLSGHQGAAKQIL